MAYPTTYDFAEIDGSIVEWSLISSSISNSPCFAAGVRADGTLWAWGDNESGQLGQGNIDAVVNPTQVGTDSDWQSVACGANCTIAIKENGTLWVTGVLATVFSYTSMTQFGADIDWKQVTVTDVPFAVLRKTDNTVWVIGDNNSGLLGVGAASVSGPVGAAVFGSIDSINALVGVTTSYTLTFSMWINLTTYGWLCYANDFDSPIVLEVADYGTIRVTLKNSDSNSFVFTFPYPLSGWVNIRCCIDTNHSMGSKVVLAYADQTTAPVTIVTDDVDNLLVDWAKYFSVSPSGEMAEIWVAPDQFFDPETKFIDPDGSPVDLGSDGSAPSGNAPSMYFHRTPSDPVDDIGINRGTGGDFEPSGLEETVTIPGPTGSDIKTIPIQVTGAYTDIAAAGLNIFALNNDQSLVGWGDNTYGQLGSDPLSISSYDAPHIINTDIWGYLSCTSGSVLAIKSDLSLWILGQYTGSSALTQVGVVNSWQKAVFYGNAIVGIDTSGILWGMGAGSSLPNSSEMNIHAAFSYSDFVQLNPDTDWVDIFAGHSLFAIKRSVNITEGANYYVAGTHPAVSGDALSGISYPGQFVSGGSLFSQEAFSKVIRVEYTPEFLLIKTDGSLWQINNTEFLLPRLVDAGVWKDAVGDSGTYFAIKEDDTLWFWGQRDDIAGSEAELDFPYFTVPKTFTPINIPGSWRKIALVHSALASRVLGIKTDGTLWGWGKADRGLLPTDDMNVPLQHPRVVTNSNNITYGNNYFTLSTHGFTTGDGQFLLSANYFSNFYVIVIDVDHFAIARTRTDALANNIATDVGSIFSSTTYISNAVVVAPTQIGVANDWQDVAAVYNFFTACKTDGTLYFCGRTTNGIWSYPPSGVTSYKYPQIDPTAISDNWFVTKMVSLSPYLSSFDTRFQVASHLKFVSLHAITSVILGLLDNGSLIGIGAPIFPPFLALATESNWQNSTFSACNGNFLIKKPNDGGTGYALVMPAITGDGIYYASSSDTWTPFQMQSPVVTADGNIGYMVANYASDTSNSLSALRRVVYKFDMINNLLLDHTDGNPFDSADLQYLYPTVRRSDNHLFFANANNVTRIYHLDDNLIVKGYVDYNFGYTATRTNPFVVGKDRLYYTPRLNTNATYATRVFDISGDSPVWLRSVNPPSGYNLQTDPLAADDADTLYIVFGKSSTHVFDLFKLSKDDTSFVQITPWSSSDFYFDKVSGDTNQLLMFSSNTPFRYTIFDPYHNRLMFAGRGDDLNDENADPVRCYDLDTMTELWHKDILLGHASFNVTEAGWKVWIRTTQRVFYPTDQLDGLYVSGSPFEIVLIDTATGNFLTQTSLENIYLGRWVFAFEDRESSSFKTVTCSSNGNLWWIDYNFSGFGPDAVNTTSGVIRVVPFSSTNIVILTEAPTNPIYTTLWGRGDQEGFGTVESIETGWLSHIGANNFPYTDIAYGMAIPSEPSAEPTLLTAPIFLDPLPMP